MKRIFVILILALSFGLGGCSSVKHSVYRVDNNFMVDYTSDWGSERKREGVFFALPKTVVTVGVPVKYKAEKACEIFPELRKAFREAVDGYCLAVCEKLTKHCRHCCEAQRAEVAARMYEIVFKNDNNPGVAGCVNLKRCEKFTKDIGSSREREVEKQIDVALETLKSSCEKKDEKTKKLVDLMYTYDSCYYKYITMMKFLEASKTPPVKESSRKFAFGEEMNLSSFGEPDPCQLFFADSKGGSFLDRDLTVELTSRGVITSGTSHAKDKRPAVALKMFTTAVAIGTQIVAGVVSPVKGPLPPDGAKGKDEYDEIGITALGILKHYQGSLPQKLDEILKDGPPKAKRLAEIYELKKELIEKGAAPGENNIGGRALAARLERLETEEKDLRSFFGKEDAKELTFSFEVRPGYQGPKSFHILTLFSSGGIKMAASRDGRAEESLEKLIADPANYTGYPLVGRDVRPLNMIPKEFQNESGEGDEKDLYVVFKTDEMDAQSLMLGWMEGSFAKKEEDRNNGPDCKAPEERGTGAAQKGGFPYRVPAMARTFVVAVAKKQDSTEKGGGTDGPQKKKLVIEGIGIREVQVAQFGKVLRLPADTGNNDSKVIAAYYPETGALKKLDTVSKAMEPEALDPFLTEVKTSSGTIMEGIKAKREADAADAAVDKEYQALVEEVDWLELKARKKAAQVTLGIVE